MASAYGKMGLPPADKTVETFVDALERLATR